MKPRLHPATPALAALLAASCVTDPPPPQPTSAAAPTGAASAATAPLPPGLLARAQGVQGEILVEERDGLRTLRISGVVQGTMRVGDTAAPTDPLVDLVRAARPDAATAVLIGLGTGRTAQALVGAGFDVTVVELEPTLPALVREHFGFSGEVREGDGLAMLVADRLPAADVYVLDVATDGGPSEALVEALGAGKPSGRALFATRFSAEPSHRLARGGPRRAGFRVTLGTGVGAEKQTIYLLRSNAPVSVSPVPASVPAWPLGDAFADAGTLPPPRAGEVEREVEVTGYLVRLEGALYLDLPHYEMGARRFVLGGDALAQLDAMLPAKATFPTQGDIGSDDDVSHTLIGLLGGGGVKRSEVRFSEVVVSLRGKARLLAVVEPDGSRRVPGGAKHADARLPHGGALYELDVAEVVARVDRATWAKSKPRIEEALRAAQKSLASGQLAEALQHATRARAAKGLPDSVRGGAIDELAAISASLELSVTKAPPGSSPLAVGGACEAGAAQLADRMQDMGFDVRPWAEATGEAYGACAVGRYREAVRAGGADAERARARLDELAPEKPEKKAPPKKPSK